MATVKETRVVITLLAKDGTERKKEITINKPIAPRKTIEWVVGANELKGVKSYTCEIVEVSCH